jgi:protein N-terminal methyltransferase
VRALDVGAGIGRVTADTLLHLVADVVLVEPVGRLVREAFARAPGWKGVAASATSVTVLQGTLQELDPGRPEAHASRLGRAGFVPEADDADAGFDVIWGQWCLMYMSDRDLVAFLRRCKAALRDERSVIVVKENAGKDGQGPDGQPTPLVYFDEDDSSVARCVALEFGVKIRYLGRSSAI